MRRRGARILGVVLLAVLAVAGAASGQSEAELRQAFANFLSTKDVRIDSVPDLYPGGYARISVYARKANLGGMVVDEIWFRLVGASLDPAALQQGTLQFLDTRDTAMYARTSIKSLEDYFRAGNPIKDIRLWSDGDYLYGEGTVPLGGTLAKVWLKGFFAVGGTKEVYFYVDNLRINGLPVFDPIIRKLEADINPVLTQATWPVTFKIRALKITKDWFVVSSQQDPSAPCAFCTGGDSPSVAP